MNKNQFIVKFVSSSYKLSACSLLYRNHDHRIVDERNVCIVDVINVAIQIEDIHVIIIYA